MKSIELRGAWVWTCEECGRDNFEHGIAAEMDEAEEAIERIDFGIEPEDEGEFMLMPMQVECEACQIRFTTRTPDQGGEDVADTR